MVAVDFVSGTQLSLGQIVGSRHVGLVEKGEEMVALLSTGASGLSLGQGGHGVGPVTRAPAGRRSQRTRSIGVGSQLVQSLQQGGGALDRDAPHARDGRRLRLPGLALSRRQELAMEEERAESAGKAATADAADQREKPERNHREDESDPAGLAVRREGWR
jgi:hypothetical protein